ncbi:MAG: hypothetical protein QHH10_10960 [Peptococcaceae bacterium]|jgi:hypothetical protein|nr:hypothetical protein [Peptococcaceae bacterium]MDH7525819.1 hypothetical protein [Peptococcaceae bacterium]
MIAAALFALGIALLFAGLFVVKRTSRFREDLFAARRKRLLGMMRPLLYLSPWQRLAGCGRLHSTAGLEDLLTRAGNPGGIKARHILLARAVSLVLAVLAPAAYYGFFAVSQSARHLVSSGGLSVFENPPTAAPAAAVFIFAAAAFYAPGLIILAMVKRREMIVLSEQGLFTEIVFISLRAKLSLRDSIMEAAKTTVYLKPYLAACLNEWHTSKERALSNLKQSVAVPGFQVVIDLLLQAASVGDERIAGFLEENKKLEEELKNIDISAKSKIRPLVMTVQMVFPFLILLIVLFYPLITQVELLIYSF